MGSVEGSSPTTRRSCRADRAVALVERPKHWHDQPAKVRLTFFRSAARGLHVPATLTPEIAKRKARKRRASERPRVGCCEELGGSCYRNFMIQFTFRFLGRVSLPP